MPPMILTCPACKTALRPPASLPAGARLRCTRCAAVFAVGPPAPATEKAAPPAESREDASTPYGVDDEPVVWKSVERPPRPARRRRRDDEEDDRPRGRRRKKAGGGGLVVGLLVGGGVLLLLLLAGCGVGAWWAFGGWGGGGAVGGGGIPAPFGLTRVTPENYYAIQPGMTAAQVQAILGPPTQTRILQRGL